MTLLDQREIYHPSRPGAVATEVSLTLIALLMAGLAGVALGLVDLYALSRLGSPWPDLINTCAGWALAAFALGAIVSVLPGIGSVRAAAAGAVMLSAAVWAYYSCATAFDMHGKSAFGSAHAQTWLLAGIVSGAVFGIAGSWTSGRVWWQRVLGAATGCGVLVGEALHLVRNGGGHGIADLMVLLGLVTLVVSARDPRVLVPAAVLALPSALFWANVLGTTVIHY